MRHLFCDRKLLTSLPDIYFYTPYLPSTHFAAERFQACALQLPDIEVLGLLFLTAPHSDTAYIYSKYIYWDCGKRRGLYFPCRGSPLPNEPVWQYRCVNLPKTDGNNRIHENDANALSWHKVNESSLLSGQSALTYRTNSSQLFWNGLFQKKQKNRGVWRHSFLKKNPGIFFVLFCNPGNLKQNKAPPLEIW